MRWRTIKERRKILKLTLPPPHLHVHPYVHVCMYAHECICNSVPHTITGRRISQTLIWSHSPQELMMLGKMQLRPYSIELQTVPETINKTQFGLLRTLCHLGERMAVFTSVDKLAIPVNKECNNLSTQSCISRSCLSLPAEFCVSRVLSKLWALTCPSSAVAEHCLAVDTHVQTPREGCDIIFKTVLNL